MNAKTTLRPWQRIKTRKGLVSRAAIQQIVQKIAGRFKPQTIYLFGSYAYGRPHRDSDVDLLVVMRTRNEIEQGARIHYYADAPFPMDVIVRTPKDLEIRLRDEDWFLRDVVERGIVCHEAGNARVA